MVRRFLSGKVSLADDDSEPGDEAGERFLRLLSLSSPLSHLHVELFVAGLDPFSEFSLSHSLQFSALWLCIAIARFGIWIGALSARRRTATRRKPPPPQSRRREKQHETLSDSRKTWYTMHGDIVWHGTHWHTLDETARKKMAPVTAQRLEFPVTMLRLAIAS